MKIRIGQVFRVSHRAGDNIASDANSFENYISLTQGIHSSGADIYKGVWAYRKVNEAGHQIQRIPAIILHSNPLKEDSESTPWIDIVQSDYGYAIYNGDNRRSSSSPLDARGNSILSQTQRFYADPDLRKFAPPILLFTQREVNGNRKGFREFSGYGVPTQYMLNTQREKKSDRYFTNLVIELALFRLDVENEIFDWKWIDLRRNGKLNADEVLNHAPASWKLWAREGLSSVEKCRRRVSRHYVTSTVEQLNYSKNDSTLLKEISKYYVARHHAFEGLAALVAERVVGQNCKRAWITKRSGDGGVDFVCRLDLGSDFSRVPVVVLGQAKCQKSVSGKDIARLVARLQRGWIGVFVTTGIFSRRTQEELFEDKYPVILINGKRLAREIRLILNQEDITLNQLLERERAWYETNLQPMDASRVLDNIFFSTRINRMTDSRESLQ